MGSQSIQINTRVVSFTEGGPGSCVKLKLLFVFSAAGFRCQSPRRVVSAGCMAWLGFSGGGLDVAVARCVAIGGRRRVDTSKYSIVRCLRVSSFSLDAGDSWGYPRGHRLLGLAPWRASHRRGEHN